MAAYTLFAVCLCFYSSLARAAQNEGFLSRNRNTNRARTGFSYSMKDPVAQTLLTLDTNRNGRIEPTEIADYARMNGMDAAAATEEFSSIDTNGDGNLDSSELQLALGTATTKTAAEANVAPVVSEVVPQQLSQAAPVMPAFADPIVSEVGDASLSSINTPSPTFVSAMNAYAQNAAVVPQLLSKIEAPASSQAPAPTTIQEATSQVSNADILEDSSRQSALTAARRVSEQLVLEESEERKAREFDQQAADMRSKSIALAKQSSQDALDAGAKAAHENADSLLAKLTQLEDQAERAEVKAAALSAKSKMELEEANSFMAIANKAMQSTSEKNA